MDWSGSGVHESARVDHLNRVLRTIVGINRLIVQEKDRNQLLQQSCNILTANRDYRFAWIGVIDPPGGEASSRASSGFESAYHSLLDADWEDFVSKSGPAGKALLTKQTVIVCCPEHLIQIRGVDGYGAHCSGMAAVPLVSQGEVRGVLVVYTIDANYFDDGEISLLEEVAGDIAFALRSLDEEKRRREAEERLRYMVMHDTLTGVYNRAYFEEEMRRMEARRNGPVSMIICDVDGLKLVNDAWGHDAGDTLLRGAAEVIRGAFRATDCVARIGGDEFAVILPATDYEMGSTFINRIRERQVLFNKENQLVVPLSISIGLATIDRPEVPMNDLFKEADNAMYRQQLLSKTSPRRAVGQALMAALDARDFITEGHAERLQELAADFGRTLHLTEITMSNLRLLAQFHDIGKVGTPDSILFKRGPLTEEERAEMQRHSEIGHRIALSTGDLASIADLILKHHEWWNGSGYPLGLRGEEIPIECRILAILDAYDAMTSDRPYRKAMPPEQALAEIERCAGTQFDPELVPSFIAMIKSQNRA